MSLIDAKKIKNAINEMIAEKIRNFSFIDAGIFLLGVILFIYGIWKNELAWIPTALLLIDKVRGKNQTDTQSTPQPPS
jgi:hypothetical protein